MNRRDILKYASISAGVAVSVPFASAFLVGCKLDVTSTDGSYVSSAFSKEEFDLLGQVMNTILPASDSPSATDVKVHLLLDDLLTNVYDQEDREKSLKEMKQLFSSINERSKSGLYSELSSEEQANLLQELLDNDSDKIATQALKSLKYQTVALYLTTERIAKEQLNYLPIPGAYESCIDVKSVDNKAWAI